MKALLGKIVVLFLCIGFGLGIWSQSRANTTLREEQTRLREQSNELARLKENKKKLQGAHITNADLEKLKADADKAERLLEQIERNKAGLAKLNTPPATGTAAVPADPSTPWRNVGHATPSDTLHSVIWAAINGDVDALVPMITFDRETRAAAETFLQSQPEAIRAQYPTIEKLVATIMSGSISTGLSKADLVKHTEFGPDNVAATFTLQSVSRGGPTPLTPTRNVTFRFQKTGDNWKLLVPASAIEGYRQMLAQP